MQHGPASKHVPEATAEAPLKAWGMHSLLQLLDKRKGFWDSLLTSGCPREPTMFWALLCMPPARISALLTFKGSLSAEPVMVGKQRHLQNT